MGTDRTREVARSIIHTVPVMMQSIMFELRRAQHTMPLPHFQALMIIAHGGCSMSELADRQRVTLPTMSKTVSVLVERGWAERVADEHDRRRADVRLTAEGTQAVSEMYANAERLIGSRLEALSDEEVEGLRGGLASIRKAFMMDGGGAE